MQEIEQKTRRISASKKKKRQSEHKLLHTNEK